VVGAAVYGPQCVILESGGVLLLAHYASKGSGGTDQRSDQRRSASAIRIGKGVQTADADRTGEETIFGGPVIYYMIIILM
jgi:hypothetical protein